MSATKGLCARCGEVALYYAADHVTPLCPKCKSADQQEHLATAQGRRR